MSTPPAKRPPISEETVNKMLATQAKEQELKAKELEIRQHELKAQAAFAQSMLEAQVADRGSERLHVTKLQLHRMIAIGIGFAVLLIFLSYAMHLGHGDLVFEFGKLLVSAIVGAFGGYGYKAHKDSQRQGPIDESN
jgi:Fe2+ transport system protein B